MKINLPSWLMPVIAVVGVIVVAFAVWQAISGFEKPVGRDITVRPGQYNLREEMQKPQIPNKRGHTNGSVSPSAGSTS